MKSERVSKVIKGGRGGIYQGEDKTQMLEGQ